MQIVSGRLDRPVVHFEALPSAQVPDEMDRYVDWFNRTGPGAEEPLSALTRAGLSHLYFESIHPFEDGTGRLGRVLATAMYHAEQAGVFSGTEHACKATSIYIIVSAKTCSIRAVSSSVNALNSLVRARRDRVPPFC